MQRLFKEHTLNRAAQLTYISSSSQIYEKSLMLASFFKDVTKLSTKVRDHCTVVIIQLIHIESSCLTLLIYWSLYSRPYNFLYGLVLYSVYTINCWSSGLATSTWTYSAAKSLLGLIAALLLPPRLLPLPDLKLRKSSVSNDKHNLVSLLR